MPISSFKALSRRRWQAYPQGEGGYPLKEKGIDEAPIAKVILPPGLASCQLGADRSKHTSIPIVDSGSHALQGMVHQWMGYDMLGCCARHSN